MESLHGANNHNSRTVQTQFKSRASQVRIECKPSAKQRRRRDNWNSATTNRLVATAPETLDETVPTTVALNTIDHKAKRNNMACHNNEASRNKAPQTNNQNGTNNGANNHRRR